MSNASRKSAKNSRASRKNDKQDKQRNRIIIGFGLLAVIALAYVFYPRADTPEVSAARLEDNPSLGADDAPVTLIEYGDFTCSACRSWHQAGVIDELMANYGDDLRVEWRDFPIITADSPKAAQAGQCAYDQDLFWEYLDRVYNQPGSSYTNAGVADLRTYAADIGLDMDAFNACLDNNQHKSTVDYDLDAAKTLRLPGTPSFLVNGKPVIGANPQLLTQAIDASLAAKK